MSIPVALHPYQKLISPVVFWILTILIAVVVSRIFKLHEFSKSMPRNSGVPDRKSVV